MALLGQHSEADIAGGGGHSRIRRALFDSWSTHPNPGQELTVTGKGGLVRLWDNLAATRATRFPVKRLKAFVGDRRQPPTRRHQGRPMTLGDLIYGKSGR
jgi:hypothetical protein